MHYYGFSRQKALQFFADYAWDESDTALREVTRYQSAPGQATAYMIGQQHIKKLRNDAQRMLGDKFNLRDFHYHLLSQGSSPLSYLEESIEAYVKCVKNEKAAGCYDVLNPAVKDEDAEDDDVMEDDRYQPTRRRHYFWSKVQHKHILSYLPYPRYNAFLNRIYLEFTFFKLENNLKLEL